MGNLPFSRTVTLNPSDPVPSSLLDELQDQIIGFKHGDLTWRRQFTNPGSEVNGTSGSMPGTAPGFIVSAASGSFAASLDPVVVGDTIMSLDFTYALAAGDVVFRADLVEVIRAPGGSPANATTTFNGQTGVTTIGLNQRLSVLSSSINSGSGLIIRSDAMYYGQLTFISAATVSARVFDMRWVTRRG